MKGGVTKMEKYYTVKEVCIITGYSERSIRQFIKDGRIKSIRTVTNSVRISESELNAFMNSKERK